MKHHLDSIQQDALTQAEGFRDIHQQHLELLDSELESVVSGKNTPRPSGQSWDSGWGWGPSWGYGRPWGWWGWSRWQW